MTQPSYTSENPWLINPQYGEQNFGTNSWKWLIWHCHRGLSINLDHETCVNIGISNNFSITGSKNRETGSYKTVNRRRCDVLHDIYQSEVIPDRKVYVYKVLKAFLKNRKYFRSKPEADTCFFEITELDLMRKATSIVHLLPI